MSSLFLFIITVLLHSTSELILSQADAKLSIHPNASGTSPIFEGMGVGSDLKQQAISIFGADVLLLLNYFAHEEWNQPKNTLSSFNQFTGNSCIGEGLQ